MPNINFLAIKNELKNTLSLSLPLVASQMVYACSGFLGTAMVAHLGADALAASVLVSMIWMTLSVLFFGILNAVSVLVAHQFGAKNYDLISEIMGQAFFLGILVSISIILLLGLVLPQLLQLTNQPPIVFNLALQYLHAILWMIPGLILMIIYEQFLAGINRSKLVLAISLIVVPIEVTLIYLFVFGKLGLPALGVAGIGYGFTITYSGTAIFLTLYLFKKTIYKKYNIFSRFFRLNFAWLKELIIVGSPMGAMHVIELSAFTLATFWIARFGTIPLAAHQVVLQYLSFVITSVFAMSQAVTIRVGHAVGREDISGIHYAVYVGMLINFVSVVLLALAFLLFPDFFLSLDIDTHSAANQLLLQSSITLLMIAIVLMFFDNFRIIGFGALRGLKDTKFPMYASLISFWIIGLSFAYLFGFILQFKAKGIWWGLTIGIISGAIIVLTRVRWLTQSLTPEKLVRIKSLRGGMGHS